MLTNEAELLAEREAQRAAEAAAKAAAKEAAIELRRAEARKQEAAARAKRHAAELPHLQAIGRALPAGTKWSIDGDNRFVIEGIDVTHRLSFETTYARSYSSFRTGAATGQRITVCRYGERTSYPQRKDKTFNYAAIADKLLYAAQAEAEANKRERQKLRNEGQASALKAELGLPDYYGAMRLSASPVTSLPVFVTMEIKQSMTAEQVRILHAALLAAGIIKKS